MRSEYSCEKEITNLRKEVKVLLTKKRAIRGRRRVDVSGLEKEYAREGNASRDRELHHHPHFKPTPINYQSLRRPTPTEGTSELRN